MHLLPVGMAIFSRNGLLGFLIVAYPLAQFFAMPLIRELSNDYGRKKMLQLSLLGSGLSYLLSSVAVVVPSIVILFLSRMLAGIFAGNLTLAQAGLGDLSTSDTRVKNFALVSVAGDLAFLVGPFLGGPLASPSVVNWFNISTPFYVAAFIFILVMVVLTFVLKEPHKVHQNKTKLSLMTGVKNVTKIKKCLN